MKASNGLVAIATILGLTLSATAARADGDGFATFWQRFRPAVAKDDRAALAAMTGPDLGTFPAFHARYLKPAVRRCLAAGKPKLQPDADGAPTYFVKCGSTDYVFMKSAGSWRLDDMELDD